MSPSAEVDSEKRAESHRQKNDGRLNARPPERDDRCVNDDNFAITLACP